MIRKSSIVISLVLIGAACSNNEQVNCDQDPKPAACRDAHGGYYHGYIYRPYFYNGSVNSGYRPVTSGGFSASHSFGSTVRGGFGSIGHAFSVGG